MVKALTAATLLSLAACTEAMHGDVVDSFSRADSDVVGKTEVGGFAWVENGEKKPHAACIKGNGLFFNYAATASAAMSVDLDGYQAADVEIRVKARPYYGEKRLYGVSYRLSSVKGTYQSEGYHVLLNEAGVKLAFGRTTIAEKQAVIPKRKWHRIRVLAEGDRHRVHVDGALLLDVTDKSRLAAGHVGLTHYYEHVWFDDFAAGKPGTLADLFAEPPKQTKPAPPRPKPFPEKPAPPPPPPVKEVTIRYGSIRHAFLRGEEARLPFDVLTPVGGTVKGAELSLDVASLIRRKLRIEEIGPASIATRLVRIDTRLLKAGEYEIRCQLRVGARVLAASTFPFWVAQHWNPDRMRVWLWPHTKFGIHVKKLDDIARRQFAWYADIGVNSFQPYGELDEGKFDVFDYGLVNGWEMGVGLSGGLRDKFEGLSPDARYKVRRKKQLNDPVHPQVAQRQDEKNREAMEIVRQFPAVRTSFFNSEIVDCMMGIETPMAKQLYGGHLGFTVPHEFVLPGVIPDRDARYVRRLYSARWGDGLTTANARAARLAHEYDPGHTVFTDPHRRYSAYGRFPELDLISTWTYTNPDPKLMLYIETLIATAKPAGQGVMQTVTLLNYPGTIFPKDQGWTVMGPARLVETSWINLSRRPDGLAVYLSSECDPFNTAAKKGDENWWAKDQRIPYQRNPETSAAFRKFTTEVVKPYGPMVKKLRRAPRRAAVLSSESSRVYNDSPNLLGYYGPYQIYSFYALLSMIHVPADVIFDETIVRYGLEDYDVLVLPKCDTLIKTVYDRILAFQKRGGLVVSDQYLRAPIPNVLKFDFDLTYRTKVSANAILESEDYAQWDDRIDVKTADMKEVKGVTAELDQKLMERYAAKLRSKLGDKAPRVVDCSSPTALLNMLEAGAAKYLFVINDKRTYGERVGQYQAMLDKAVPQTVTLTLNEWPHAELHVYDLLGKKKLACTRKGDTYTFDTDLPAPGGKIIALLPQELAKVEIRAPSRIIRRGVPHRIHVLVEDPDGRPVVGAQPLHVELTDPEGALSELNGYYAAESGVLCLDFTPALNDRAGTWTVEAVELTAGLRTRATFEVTEPPG